MRAKKIFFYVALGYILDLKGVAKNNTLRVGAHVELCTLFNEVLLFVYWSLMNRYKC